MQKLIGLIRLFTRFIYTGWNLFFWNYHCGQARLHDDRIKFLDPEWRDEFEM